MNIIIRLMTSDDSDHVAELSAELGYPATVKDTKNRITRLLEKADHHLLVACRESRQSEVLAWIHIRINESLEIPTHGEIAALVVGESYRGNKIGQKLVKAAEKWCSEKVDSIQLRSKISRVDAHAFYQKLEYQITKTSYLFVKDL